MERIKQALDKARQERLIRQTGATPPSITPLPGGGPVVYDQTQEITLDEQVLRENRILTSLEPSAFSDAYNLLRTQVLLRFKENNWNVLAVTSPGSGEGKTLTAINLAISIAREVDYTVLLVDANLRHPWMLEHFGLEGTKGLSDTDCGNADKAVPRRPPGSSPRRGTALQFCGNAEFTENGTACG
jgi:protein-tyrosine kinase